ncbi:hypothetical protein BZL30_7363 [Mycobacterium kansasii]|uniref:Uncharacterized protein n=1 Tax=Mycobacterium kansasii TaxID=1768 RepID=A0A1V3WPP8_MYCKA|nr:hypothetical protein BZL30_7363 [Mycobacterium kansasii]
MLLDDVALQGDDILRGVGAGDALPPGVVVPIVLDLLSALRVPTTDIGLLLTVT